MGQKKYPFDWVLSKVATAGTNDVKTDPVRPGRLYCLQRVAVENESTAYTDLRILKGGGGQEIVVQEEDTPLADTLYWTSCPMYLTEGQHLIARLTGCTASDVIRVYVSGWWKEGNDG